MRLSSFSVENYRSITTARKVPLSQYSLLVGANNEGKSNILHALALGMDVLANWTSSTRRMPDGTVLRKPRFDYYRSSARYDWEIDFPVGKQKSSEKDKTTKITLEFILDDKEQQQFSNDIKSRLNGSLPIQITFAANGEASLLVQKPGRGQASLTKKSIRIAEFISKRLQFVYVPAIRTSHSASRIIQELVELRIASVEQNQRYQAALSTIEELQKPIFDEIEKSIKDSISRFLPNVKSVQLKPKREARAMALRREVEILVNDGNLTRLDRKGDGVQSLAALALMRQKDEKPEGVSRIIAIEEPESHLHPRAVHELRSVIEGLAADNQIVLTSHSPLFVKVQDISNTVIVKNSKAQCARSVAEIRDALGVRFSDNLQNARVVALVEGVDDVRSLSAITQHKSEILRMAIEQGVLIFDHLGGASSLGQKAAFYQASACQVQCFVDNDKAGRSAVDKAISSQAITIADVNMSTIPGWAESELEDLYDARIYKDEFLQKFGVDVGAKLKGAKNVKWSDRVKAIFIEAGKPWSDDVKNQTKWWLSEFAKENCANIVRESTSGALANFIAATELKVGAL